MNIHSRTAQLIQYVSKVVMSVQIKKNASIVEMTREATPKEIDACKLVYCGYGSWKDKHIQENIEMYVK